MNDEAALVKKAHDDFYAALVAVCNGDPEPMMRVWQRDDRVTTSHPMGTWVLGWHQVEATWNEFAKAITEGQGTVSGTEVRIYGDVAYTTCTESWRLTMLGKTLSFSVNATNIFRRTPEGWRIVHHHADKAPSFEAAV